jgi:signal transduction histidine kinase
VCVRGIRETHIDQAARHADRLVTVGLLAADVAHASKNALGILSSRIDLMLLEADESGLPEVVREDLAVLQRAARRVAATLERLLGYAVPSQQTDGPVDLSRIVGETLALLERPLARGGIRVSTDLAPALPPIRGDAEALQELLVNLILNARDAMPKGGALHVQTHPASDRARVRLVVADSGPGLPAEVAGRLWQPFASTKTRDHGHGLASIGRIVRAHGAAIEVQSEPGRGAAFILTFPTRAAGDERSENERNVSGPIRRQAADPQPREQDQGSAADTEKSREHAHAQSGSENSG